MNDFEQSVIGSNLLTNGKALEVNRDSGAG